MQAACPGREVHEVVRWRRLLLKLALPDEGRGKRAVRIVAAVAMVAIGITHFTSPSGFVKIVPSFSMRR